MFQLSRPRCSALFRCYGRSSSCLSTDAVTLAGRPSSAEEPRLPGTLSLSRAIPKRCSSVRTRHKAHRQFSSSENASTCYGLSGIARIAVDTIDIPHSQLIPDSGKSPDSPDAPGLRPGYGPGLRPYENIAADTREVSARARLEELQENVHNQARLAF